MSKFQQTCRKHLSPHPLWRGVYERIELALQRKPMRTKELEIGARLFPLSPTLRDLERLGLIEKMPGSYAGKGPFENQEWRLAAPPQSGKEGQP